MSTRLLPDPQTYTGGTVREVSISSHSEGPDLLLERETLQSSGKFVDPFQLTAVETSPEINELFAGIRWYAREHQQSVLELIAEYALDDLPVSVGRMITEYLEERKPKVKPGEVEFTGLFASGRSDLSTRMEEIIYGPDAGDDE